VTVLEANHLRVIGRQQGGDALLGHWVDIVVHCHPRDGGVRLWHANKGCAMDGGHGSCLGLLRRRRREQRVLDILWVVRGTWCIAEHLIRGRLRVERRIRVLVLVLGQGIGDHCYLDHGGQGARTKGRREER